MKFSQSTAPRMFRNWSQPIWQTNIASAASTELTLEQRVVRGEVEVRLELDLVQAEEADAALKREVLQCADEGVLHACENIDERRAVDFAPLLFGQVELLAGEADERVWDVETAVELDALELGFIWVNGGYSA